MRKTIWFLLFTILLAAAGIFSAPEHTLNGMLAVVLVGAVSFSAAITATVIILKSKKR